MVVVVLGVGGGGVGGGGGGVSSSGCSGDRDGRGSKCSGYTRQGGGWSGASIVLNF